MEQLPKAMISCHHYIRIEIFDLSNQRNMCINNMQLNMGKYCAEISMPKNITVECNAYNKYVLEKHCKEKYIDTYQLGVASFYLCK